jgi:hypothetical protein
MIETAKITWAELRNGGALCRSFQDTGPETRNVSARILRESDWQQIEALLRDLAGHELAAHQQTDSYAQLSTFCSRARALIGGEG